MEHVIIKNEKCNILIFGILSSGSSAVIDLLLEYNNLNVIPGEFDDFRAPGLVADYLNNSQYDDYPNTIDTFLKNRSIKRLIYNIFPIFNLNTNIITKTISRFNYSSLRIKQLSLLNKLNKKLHLNISKEEKIRFANNWIKEIGNINIKNKEFVVYNQPIEVGIDDFIWKAVFNPFKLICVYRDPKDQLADIIQRGLLVASRDGQHMTIAGLNIEAIYGRQRNGAIKFYIKAIKKRMEWIDSMRIKLESDKFLLIDFEGLINEYDAYKSLIEDFIGLKPKNHKLKNKFFNPAFSQKNIGIYKNILSNNELNQLKEVEEWYLNMIQCNKISTSKSII